MPAVTTSAQTPPDESTTTVATDESTTTTVPVDSTTVATVPTTEAPTAPTTVAPTTSTVATTESTTQPTAKPTAPIDAAPTVAMAPMSVAIAPQAAAVSTAYFQPAHTPTIYQVVGTGAPRALSFDEWVAAGSPSPQAAPTSYVRYAWAPSIYAVTKWQSAPSSWQWEPLTLAQWQRAGYPAPANTAFVPGSYVYKWGTSTDVLIEAPDGVNHRLTYAEWQAAGFPAPIQRSNEGFVKLSWTSSIAFMSNLAAGTGRPISYQVWSDEGFPTPQVVARFPGDSFVQYAGSPTIYYTGPTVSTRAITAAEWQAAGSPAPHVVMPPVPANSGTGRRVVYDRAQQRVWAIEADGTVVKTHRVSGRTREPYAGTYSVYSRSMYTYSANNPAVKWRYMVRFAYGPDGGRIGFHEIPNKNGVPLQTEAQLGQPLSGGCVRQSTADALWMWNWAGIGTKVVVL